MLPPSSSLRFRLRDLPVSRAQLLEGDFVRDALGVVAGQSELTEQASAGEVHMSVNIVEAQEQTVVVTGALTGWAHVACSRCVEPVKLTVDETLLMTFLPNSVADSLDDEEVELTEDDLDVASHDGNELDLAPALRDYLVLAVPYAPLCKDDCLGLCTQCGVNLNVDRCTCRPKPVYGSPWAALKNVKLGS